MSRWSLAEVVKATHGVYVDTLADGDTALSCGQCDYLHTLPTPFLLGDAVRLAVEHRRQCPEATQ